MTEILDNALAQLEIEIRKEEAAIVHYRLEADHQWDHRNDPGMTFQFWNPSQEVIGRSGRLAGLVRAWEILTGEAFPDDLTGLPGDLPSEMQAKMKALGDI